MLHCLSHAVVVNRLSCLNKVLGHIKWSSDQGVAIFSEEGFVYGEIFCDYIQDTSIWISVPVWIVNLVKGAIQGADVHSYVSITIINLKKLYWHGRIFTKRLRPQERRENLSNKEAICSAHQQFICSLAQSNCNKIIWYNKKKSFILFYLTTLGLPVPNHSEGDIGG